MQITTLGIAMWGAIVSTILAVIKVWEFFRDRPNISVEMKFGSIKTDTIGQKFLYTTPTKILPYVALRARNKGRRTVVLTNAGFRLSNQIDLHLIPSEGELPHKLEEGAEHTVLFDFKLLKQGFKDERAERVKFGWFQDGAGHTYKGKLAEVVNKALTE